jgi:hypothetical protein
MPENNPLRLTTRRVTPQAEAAILGEPSNPPAIAVAPEISAPISSEISQESQPENPPEMPPTVIKPKGKSRGVAVEAIFDVAIPLEQSAALNPWRAAMHLRIPDWLEPLLDEHYDAIKKKNKRVTKQTFMVAALLRGLDITPPKD